MISRYIYIPYLYYWGMICAILFNLRYETLLEIPSILSYGLLYTSYIALSLHLFIILPKFNLGELIILFLVLLLTIVVGINSNHFSLLYITYFLVFGTKGMCFDKIVRVHFLAGLVFCVFIVIGSLSGYVENVVENDVRLGSGLDFDNRIYFGYAWPTNFATHVFFILLIYWYLKKGVLNYIEVIIYISISLLILYFTSSRLGSGLVLLIVITSLCYKKESNIKKYICLIGLIPIFAIISIIATICYNTQSLVWIIANLFLTNRLSIGQNALESKGFSLFGQEYIMYSGVDSGINYNYIDNSYLQAAIIWGIPYLIILLTAYVIINYRAYKNKNALLLICITYAGLSGIIAQHFLQIFMNPFLLALFANHKCYFSSYNK